MNNLFFFLRTQLLSFLYGLTYPLLIGRIIYTSYHSPLVEFFSIKMMIFIFFCVAIFSGVIVLINLVYISIDFIFVNLILRIFKSNIGNTTAGILSPIFGISLCFSSIYFADIALLFYFTDLTFFESIERGLFTNIMDIYDLGKELMELFMKNKINN